MAVLHRSHHQQAAVLGITLAFATAWYAAAVEVGPQPTALSQLPGISSSTPQPALTVKQLVSEQLLMTENACAHLLMHLYSCEQDNAEWKAGVQHDNTTAVDMCWGAASNVSIHREGLLIIRETLQSTSHSTYRVRAVGPQVKQIHVQYCGQGLHLGPVSLWREGVYHFEVLRLYRNFSYLDALTEQQVVRINTFTWNLSSSVGTDASRRFSVLPDVPCIRYPLHSTWVSTLPFDAQLVDLRMSNTSNYWPSASPLVYNYNHAVLQWRPLTCRLLKWHEMMTLGCLKDRNVCFVGDSQMRNMYNGYVTILPGILRGEPEPATGFTDPSYSNHKLVFESDTAHFVWDPWGNATQVESFASCTDVILNFGQWPLSFKNGDKPWTLEEYHRGLVNRAALLAELKRQGKGALWVGVQGFPWRTTNTGDHPRDWRVQPWLHLYNVMASHIMAQHGVMQLDVFDMSSTFADLTVDGAHFVPNGTVGHAINHSLNHMLCSLHTKRGQAPGAVAR